MPVQPLALSIRCPQCGWHTHWQAQSDAITQLPPSACPKCSSTALEMEQATGIWTQLATQLKKILPG